MYKKHLTALVVAFIAGQFSSVDANLALIAKRKAEIAQAEAALKTAEAEAAAAVVAPVKAAPVSAPVKAAPVSAPVSTAKPAAATTTTTKPLVKKNIAQVATYKSGSSEQKLFYKSAADKITPVSSTKLAESDVKSSSYAKGWEVVKRYTTSVWLKDPSNNKCGRINMPVSSLGTGAKADVIIGGSDKTGYSMVNQGTLPAGCVTASSKGTANMSFPIVAIIK